MGGEGRAGGPQRRQQAPDAIPAIPASRPHFILGACANRVAGRSQETPLGSLPEGKCSRSYLPLLAVLTPPPKHPPVGAAGLPSGLGVGGVRPQGWRLLLQPHPLLWRWQGFGAGVLHAAHRDQPEWTTFSWALPAAGLASGVETSLPPFSQSGHHLLGLRPSAAASSAPGGFPAHRAGQPATADPGTRQCLGLWTPSL